VATVVTSRLQLTLDALELVASAAVDGGTSRRPHKIAINETRASGTSDDQHDLAYSVDGSVANGAPDTYDLAGSLTALDATTMTYVEVTHILIVHKSGAGDLQIGAAANDLATIWLSSGEGALIGPGGVYLWTSPTNGAVVTAGTVDILQIAASAGTITYDMIILGRSA